MRRYDRRMCRNIRNLYNFEPPATDEEIHASALQFVRKISGFNKPSQANAAAFDRAVEAVAEVSRRLLDELVDERAAEGPRGRGGEGARPRRAALRRLARVAGSLAVRGRARGGLKYSIDNDIS